MRTKFAPSSSASVTLQYRTHAAPKLLTKTRLNERPSTGVSLRVLLTTKRTPLVQGSWDTRRCAKSLTLLPILQAHTLLLRGSFLVRYRVSHFINAFTLKIHCGRITSASAVSRCFRRRLSTRRVRMKWMDVLRQSLRRHAGLGLTRVRTQLLTATEDGTHGEPTVHQLELIDGVSIHR